MFDAKEVSLEKLEVFRQNERWKKILDELLSAWTQFFNYETGHKDPYNWVDGLQVEDEKLCIQWNRTYGKSQWHSTRGYTYTVDDRIETVITRLEVLNIVRRRKWLGLRKKCIETTVLILRHEVDIPRDSISKQCWRGKSDLWEVPNVNFEYLGDIVDAIRLLRERTIDAKDVGEAHGENMQIFSEHLDGLADVF